MIRGASSDRTFVSIVVALLVPAYLILWSLFVILQAPETTAGSWIVSAGLILGMVTIGAHFVSGYTWAKWAVALLSLIFAGAQFFLFYRMSSGLLANASLGELLLLGGCGVLAVNAVWLLGSSTASAFLETRRASVTGDRMRLLSLLRWALLGVLLIGVALDLRRLLA
jgi:hypothetical protein